MTIDAIRRAWVKAPLGIGVTVAMVLAACGGAEPAATSTSAATKAAATTVPTLARQPAFKTIEQGTFTVAFVDGAMPQISLDPATGKLVGYDGFLLHRFAETYGLKIKPLATTFTGMLEAIRQNQADLAVGVYWTEARTKQMYYTMPTIYDLTGFVMLKDEPYSGPQSLVGRKVGTQEGYTYVPYLKTAYGEANVTLYQGFAAGIADLKNKRIAAYVAGTGTGVALIRQHGDLKLQLLKGGDLNMPENILKSGHGLVVNCGSPAIAKAMDEVYITVRKSGEWKEQLKPWGVDGDEFLPPLTPPQQGCGS